MATVTNISCSYFAFFLFFLTSDFLQAAIINHKKQKGEALFLTHSNSTKSKSIKQGTEEEKKDSSLIHFRGNEMKSLLKENYTLLIGDVVITHQNLRMETPKAYFYSNADKKIIKIETTSITYILREETKDNEKLEAYAKQAFYYPEEDKMTLIGDVKIYREQDTITGEHIDYSLNSDELKGTKMSGFLSSIKKK